MIPQRSTTDNASCMSCSDKGWVVLNGWPVECPHCVPTKVVKGRTVLDLQAIKRKALDASPKAIPSYTPMRRVKVNATTHQFHAYDDEA